MVGEIDERMGKARKIFNKPKGTFLSKREIRKTIMVEEY